MSDLSKIKVLPGILHVRKRPAMYLGSVDEKGISYLFTVAIGWAIGEAKTQVSVSFNEDGSIFVAHNGEGIPVRNHSHVNKSILEMLMTTLPCGGPAVDLPILTALSKEITVETTCRDAGQPKRYSMQFERAIMTSPLSEGEPTSKDGTQITFLPDPEIFGESVLDIAKAKEEIALLQAGHPKIRIEIQEK
jgi:DNA gyrase subunit B